MNMCSQITVIKVHELNSYKHVTFNSATARELTSSKVLGMKISGIRQRVSEACFSKVQTANMQAAKLPLAS